MSVGEIARCPCCKAEFQWDLGEMDGVFSNPVCPECHKDLIKAGAWLRHFGMDRPVREGDVNVNNYKRFTV